MYSRFLLGFIIAFLLLGCNSKTRDNIKESTYTIATLKGPSSMGMIRVIDSLNRDTNNSVRVNILNEPIQVRKMMLDGSADFAILPMNMAAILYNKGLDYRLVAVPVWGTLYLFGKDTSITEWDHLRGKRVYVMARGMTPDVLFRYLLQKNNIDPDNEIILDYSFPTHIDLANAVAANQADLGVISEPLVSLVMQRNQKVHPIFDLNQEWNKVQGVPIAQTAFLVKSSLVQNNESMIEKLITAYEASTKWANRNPDSAAVLIVKHNILPDIRVACSAISRSNLKFIRAKDIQLQIEGYLEVFYQMNPDIIGGKIPDENFYY